MGYTHYFKIRKEIIPGDWELIVKWTRCCFELAEKRGIKIAREHNSEDPPVANDEEIRFNGRGEDGHETFLLRRKGGNDFCKTRHAPYDAVVVAVLELARKFAPCAVQISSDGGDEVFVGAYDRLAGKMEAKKVEIDEAEKIVLFEAARMVFADPELFDELADKLDIDDRVLKELQEKLNKYMDEK